MVDATSGRYNPMNKTRYPLYGRQRDPRTGLDVFRKSHPQTGFDLLTVQDAASRYTDCTGPAHVLFTLNVTLDARHDEFFSILLCK